MLLLAGDIGGTKTILRLVRLSVGGSSYETLYEAIYISKEFPDLVPMVRHFLTAQQQSPDIACFAIAGPVVNNSCQLTNLHWSLEGEILREKLGIEQVYLINDFVAVSYGVKGLKPEDICILQGGEFQAQAPKAIIGAGTGLGQGCLLAKGKDYLVIATEGGHSDFAARNDLEWELLKYIQRKYGIAHVSVERVVSGQGIPDIYSFLRDQQYAPENAKIGEMVRNWEQKQSKVDPAAVIAQAAMQKRDRLCEKTMTMFVSAYGAEAGNLALKLLPYGGLYIAGGIAQKILPLMQSDAFMSAFHDKGRMLPLMERIPVYIVLNPQVGLLGSILYAVE